MSDYYNYMINGHNMDSRNRIMQIILVCIICMLLFLLKVDKCFAGNKDNIANGSGWNEKTLYVNSHGTISWCGPDYKLVVGAGGGTGVRIVDVSNGLVKEITKNINHRYASCSPDGRYVLISDASVGDYKNLFVYDTNSEKYFTLYSLDISLSVNQVHEPLSPSGKYLIGPANWKDKVKMPGGEELIVVPIHERGKNCKIVDYSLMRWSFDSSKLYLFSIENQTVVVRDLITNKERKIKIKINGFYAQDIKPTPDNNKLYIEAFTENNVDVSGDYVANVYEIDLDKEHISPKLIIKNANRIDVNENGYIVYSIVSGMHNSIYILNKNMTSRLVKKIITGEYAVTPRISKDNMTVAFLYRVGGDKIVIKVLNDKK